MQRSVTFNEHMFGNRDLQMALSDPQEPESQNDESYHPEYDKTAEGQNNDADPLDDDVQPYYSVSPESRSLTDNLISTTKRCRKPTSRYGDLVSVNWIDSLVNTDPVTPTSFEEAKASIDYDLWLRAMDEELDSLANHNTWREVDDLPARRRPTRC